MRKQRAIAHKSPGVFLIHVQVVTPQVLYPAQKRAVRRLPEATSPDHLGGVAHNLQILDPLDFIAQLTQHIPTPENNLSGPSASIEKARGGRAKAGGAHPQPVEIDD